MMLAVGGFVIGLPILAGGIWLILNAGTIAKSLAQPPAATRPAP
jgi:hypothetical protein